MLSLKDALGKKAAPYRPLKVNIVKLKQCVPIQMTLADQSCSVKCVVAADADTSALKEGTTIIMRNYNAGREVLFCNKSTKVTKTAPQVLSAERTAEAQSLIDPPAPLVQAIKDVVVDQKTTIVGTVEKVCTESMCEISR